MATLGATVAVPNDELSAEQVRISICTAEFHAEVDKLCAAIAKAPGHGLARDPRSSCPWMVKLSNMFARHAEKLPMCIIIPHVALAGDRFVECQEYLLAHQCCYSMAASVAEQDAATTLRCQVGSSYCIARLTQRKDPQGHNRETLQCMVSEMVKMVNWCKAADARLAWIVKNATVLLYQIVMDLLAWGFAEQAAALLERVLTQLIAPSPLLSTAPHLSWRLQLVTALALCYEELRAPEAFGTLIDQALNLWAVEDPAKRSTPSQQRLQAKRLGSQLPLLVARAKGLRTLWFKHAMFPISAEKEKPAAADSEAMMQLPEPEIFEQECEPIRVALNENFSTVLDKVYALDEALGRPWRRTVNFEPPAEEQVIKVRALLTIGLEICKESQAVEGMLRVTHRLARAAFNYCFWELFEQFCTLCEAKCGPADGSVATELALLKATKQLYDQDASTIEVAMTARLAYLTPYSQDNADRAIVSDVAKLLWDTVKTSLVISTPLQGEAFMELQKKLEAQEAVVTAATGKGRKWKTVLDMDAWKKRPEAPPPPPHNLAEAALNGLIAVRYADTAFVLAAGIRVGLAMAHANERRRGVQTLRSCLNLASRHRHEIAGQVAMCEVDSILSITTNLRDVKAKHSLEYTWSAEVQDQTALEMQVNAISLLFKMELDLGLHQQHLDTVITGAPGLHKVGNAANVSDQLGLKKTKAVKSMTVRGPDGEEIDLDERKYSKKETALLAECRQSPYHKALLYIEIALFRKCNQQVLTEFRDKVFYKELLDGAWGLLVQAQEEEHRLLAWTQSHPSVVVGAAPPPPRFVSRSTSTVTFEPQPFASSDGRAVHAYALYGKKYGTGVDVSLNDKEAPGLGVKVLADDQVRLTATGLSPHEQYLFAVVAYDKQGIEIGGIGATSQPITMVVPLCVTGAMATLSVASFKLEHSHVMLQAGEFIHNKFVQGAPVGQLALQQTLKESDYSISTQIWLKDITDVPSEQHLLDLLDEVGFKRRENWQLAGAATVGHIAFDKMLMFVRQKKVLLSMCNRQHAALAKEWFCNHPGEIYGAVFSKYENGSPLLVRSPMEMEELDRMAIASSATALVRSFITVEYMLAEATLQRILKPRTARENVDTDSYHQPPLSQQITRLEACKRLTIALEASLAIDDDKLVVETIGRIFRLLEPLLLMPQPSPYVLSVLVACDVAVKTMSAARLAKIPKGRVLSCSVMYFLQQLCTALDESAVAVKFAGVEDAAEEEPVDSKAKRKGALEQEPEEEPEDEGPVEAEVLAFKECMLVLYGKMPDLGPAEVGKLRPLQVQVLNKLANETSASAFEHLIIEDHQEDSQFAELSSKVLEKAVKRGGVAMETLCEWHEQVTAVINEKQKVPALVIPAYDPENPAPLLDLPDDPTAPRIKAIQMKQANTLARMLVPLYHHRKKLLNLRTKRERDLRWKALALLSLAIKGYEAEMGQPLRLSSEKPEYGLDKEFLIIEDARFMKKVREDKKKKEKTDALDSFEANRVTNPDGTKRIRPLTPEPEPLEPYEDAESLYFRDPPTSTYGSTHATDRMFQWLARSAVLAMRAGVWILMLNACRLMHNLALKLYHTPADAVASCTRRTAAQNRQLEICERQLKQEMEKVSTRNDELVASLNEQISKLSVHAATLNYTEETGIWVSSVHKSQHGWRSSPAGCLQTASECVLAYLEHCSKGSVVIDDEDEEQESDSSADGQDVWFKSRPDVDIDWCFKMMTYVIEMCFCAGRDRTTVDLGKLTNQLTMAQYAEPLLGFMMRAAFRRSLEEELSDFALQFKNIKRDKPLANETLDAARRALCTYLKMNGRNKRMQDVLLLDNGASAMSNLISKDNPMMLAIQGQPTETDKESESGRREVFALFEKSITVLRQKKSTFLVAQACLEAGNFSYALSQHDRAAEFWKDGLDASLLNLDSLKYWRSLFDRSNNLLQAFGFWEVLCGSVLLYHSAYYTHSNNLHMQAEAVSMAGTMLGSVFSASFPHPQRACDFKAYHPKETWPSTIPLDLFASPYVLYPITLVETLEFFSRLLLLRSEPLQALPVLSLYNYVSMQLCNDWFGSLNARIKKVQALTRCGFMAEAVQELLALLNNKDLPAEGFSSKAGMRPEGEELPEQWASLQFFNGLCAEDPKNELAIGSIVRSGIPRCIIDPAVSTPLDPVIERPYLIYQYCITIAELLIALSNGKNLLFEQECVEVVAPPESQAKCFFEQELARPKCEPIAVSSYMLEAEAILKELEAQCVGLDEEQNPKDPDEFDQWLGNSAEADFTFCQLSLVLCEIKTTDGNYEHAVKLLERVLRVMEAQKSPEIPKMATACSVPAKECGESSRHPRSQLNTLIWLQARTRLIEILLLQGEYESCEQQCAIAAKESADCNEQQLMMRVSVAHATIMTLRGKPQDALIEYEQLISVARSARADDEVFSTALVNCGDLRRFMGQHKAALAMYHEAYKVMDNKLAALGLDTAAGVFKNSEAKRGLEPVVVVHKKPEIEEGLAAITRADMLDCVHHPVTHLFVDVALRKAQMQSELGELDQALEVLCVARDTLERVTHPLPRTVAQLNLLFGRVHSQMEWSRLSMSCSQWGSSTQSEQSPTEHFEFADSCMRECFRIISEVSNHDHVMLRLCLLELSRLHGMESQSEGLRVLLQRGSEIATMQHKLYYDTLSLFDAAEISGENIVPGISAGVIDSLRFFKQSRAAHSTAQQAKKDQASVEVSAPALLMYHLTMVRESTLSGVQLGKLMEINSTLLHRSLKSMFPHYVEHCCTTSAALPVKAGETDEAEVDDKKKGKPDAAGVPAGVVSFVWGEFPLGAAVSSKGSESPSSRPSSAASIAVQRSRANEAELEPKRLAATLMYSMVHTAPLAAEEEEPLVTPITGIVECSVPVLEALKRDLGSSKFDLECYVPPEGADKAERPPEMMQAAMECLAKCHAMIHQGSEVQEWNPEQAMRWVPTLAKMFNREVGFTGQIDEDLRIWLVQSLRPDRSE